jgi:hypothetical protein
VKLSKLDADQATFGVGQTGRSSQIITATLKTRNGETSPVAKKPENHRPPFIGWAVLCLTG